MKANNAVAKFFGKKISKHVKQMDEIARESKIGQVLKAKQ